jgi:hypothetical protein
MGIKVVSFLFVCLIPLRLLAWGSGHDQVNELAVEMLHGIIPAESAANIVKWSHTPDDFTPWEKLKHFQVPPDDLRLLKAHKLDSPHSAHCPKGQAVAFILLANAFRDNDVHRIAFWSACLLHALADEAACNHDPLIHYATYAFTSGYRLKTGAGVGLDFSAVAGTPEGKDLVRRLAAAEIWRPLPSDPDEALLAIMLSGLESNAYMTSRGSTIAASFALDATQEQLTAAKTALAELGVHGAARGRDVIRSAKESAQRGTIPNLTSQLEAEFGNRKAVQAAVRPLSDDSLYADLLKSQAPVNQSAIGVLVEPSITMNAACFSFGAKLITAAAARSMRLAGVPFRLVDVRDLAKKQALNPQETPVLFVCAGPFNVGRAAKDALAAYATAGGRFLWIGGEHGGLLGRLSENLIKADPATLPVSGQYGQDTPVSGTARFRFLAEFKEALGEQSYRFVHNPNTKAGWQVPRCRYLLGPAEGVAVLAEMHLPDGTSPVAGAWMGPDGKAKAIFIPEYLIAPYVLSDEDTIQDLSRPTLDKVGSRLLSASLALLRP